MKDKEIPDRSGVSITPRIGASIHVEFHNFTPLNDALVGWMASYLRGRKEVKAVETETIGLNQDNAEVTGGEQQENPPGQSPGNAPVEGKTW